MLELKDQMLTLGMVDLRFQGCAHTWTNKRPRNPITKKLERALVNEKWVICFPDSIASFLPTEFSDHSPCVINLSCPLSFSGTRPFKYLNLLSVHPLFLPTVEASWNQSGTRALDLHSLGFKLKSIKKSLKILNRESFSDIEKRVRVTNSLVKAVQVKALDNPSTTTFQAERDLHKQWIFLRGI